MTMKILYVLSCIICIIVFSKADCNDNKDCTSCAYDRQFFRSCRWCALTRECHVKFSAYNHCKSDQQVTDPGKCAAVAEPSLQYDPKLAEVLASWSGAAYTYPQNQDAISLKSAIRTVLGLDYELVEFVRHDCTVVLDYDDCAAVVGISKNNQRIFVAFRGSTATTQVAEQALQTATGMRDFPTAGGKILAYYKNAHDDLYPCVKGVVQELLSRNPGFKIAVTGHSLGGALAQLAAVRLVKEGVASKENLDVYTFGSPRLGNKDFAFAYDRIIGNSWRVVNTKDPVPLIVPTHLLGISFAYHTRREVYYSTQPMSTNTPYKLCLGNEDQSCARKGLTCLICIDEHQMYFAKDLPRVVQQHITDSGDNTPVESTRGKCEAFKY